MDCGLFELIITGTYIIVFQGDIQWKVLGHTYEYDMELNNGTFRQYRFGIAVEMGSLSSGITWSSCTYNRNSGIQACTQEGGYEDPPNSQKYTKKVHTVCISKIQGSFITL